MNIVMITENDPAGMGITFKNAINQHTSHCCRLITTTTKYNFDFEKDLHVPDLDENGFDEIRQLLHQADIIHFHILADEHIRLGRLKVKDFVGKKVIVHHHHGHPDFRKNPEKYREKYRNLARKTLVSTPDLLRLLPEASWQPNLVPINAPLYLPCYLKSNGAVLIGQSVTRKDLKNTEDLLSVVGRISRTTGKRELVARVIEKTNHRECLRQKARCHIIFDHMQGYFGVSSLESLSQGKAVIAGLDDWNIGKIKEFTGSQTVPWLVCRNKEELGDTLLKLLDDVEKCSDLGRTSRRFMEDCWSDDRAIKNLVEFYTTL